MDEIYRCDLCGNEIDPMATVQHVPGSSAPVSLPHVPYCEHPPAHQPLGSSQLGPRAMRLYPKGGERDD